VRLPRALSSTFISQALRASDGIPGLSAAMQGLVAARAAVLAAILVHWHKRSIHEATWV
jgi:hypothetical protein